MKLYNFSKLDNTKVCGFLISDIDELLSRFEYLKT